MSKTKIESGKELEVPSCSSKELFQMKAFKENYMALSGMT